MADGSVTDQEVDQWIDGLSDGDKEELKRLRLQQRAIAREAPKTPDLGKMTDQEFAAYRRSIGLA
jgi:hypothetical protein